MPQLHVYMVKISEKARIQVNHNTIAICLETFYLEHIPFLS